MDLVLHSTPVFKTKRNHVHKAAKDKKLNNRNKISRERERKKKEVKNPISANICHRSVTLPLSTTPVLQHGSCRSLDPRLHPITRTIFIRTILSWFGLSHLSARDISPSCAVSCFPAPCSCPLVTDEPRAPRYHCLTSRTVYPLFLLIDDWGKTGPVCNTLLCLSNHRVVCSGKLRSCFLFCFVLSAF